MFLKIDWSVFGASILALLGDEWAKSPPEEAPISLSFKLLAKIESGAGIIVTSSLKSESLGLFYQIFSSPEAKALRRACSLLVEPASIHPSVCLCVCSNMNIYVTNGSIAIKFFI